MKPAKNYDIKFDDCLRTENDFLFDPPQFRDFRHAVLHVKPRDEDRKRRIYYEFTAPKADGGRNRKNGISARPSRSF